MILIPIAILFLIPSAFAQIEDPGNLGISELLDETFEKGENFTNIQLKDCEIEAISATNEECLALAEAGFDALQQSKDLAFSLHKVVKTLIQFLSPIQLGGAVLALASAIIGLMFFLKIGKKFGRHALEVFLILGGLGLFFLVIGDTLEI